jgi:hypothetical protein
VKQASQREEICMGSYNNFWTVVFGMNHKERIGKKNLGAGATMVGKL